MSLRRRWLKGLIWSAAAAGLLYFVWSLWEHRAIAAWLQEAHPFPFFMSMSLLPMFGVPITPFFILAGGIFGAPLGMVGSILALGVNLIGCYVVARTLRPRLEAWLHRLGYKLPDFTANEKGSIRFILAVKFAPGVPTFIKNYGLAIAGVGFLPYFFASILITGAYAILIIVLGDSLFEHNHNQLLRVAAVLGAFAIGLWWWRRRRGGTT